MNQLSIKILSSLSGLVRRWLRFPSAEALGYFLINIRDSVDANSIAPYKFIFKRLRRFIYRLKPEAK